MKQAFNITHADRVLLVILVRIAPAVHAMGMGNDVRRTILQVLGEKHGFKPETAEPHPTDDLVMAEPAEPKICLT